MTITKNGNIISLNVNRTELDTLFIMLRDERCGVDFVNVINGYIDTYERDK